MKDNFIVLEKAIKNAIKVFSEINIKIDSLLSCSARDFIILNHAFQEYCSKIKAVSGKINSTIEFGNSLFGENNSRPNLNVVINTFTALQEEMLHSDIKLTEINKHLSFIHLLINNIKQDIGTFRLLATNLRFNPSLSNAQDSIMKNLVHINKCTSSFSENVSSLSHDINSFSSLINIQNDTILTRFRNTLQKTAYQFESKTNEINRFNDLLSEISKINENKASSSDEIITHLQFDDIIRQKIEHIKKAQEVLLLDLKTNLEKQDCIKKDVLVQVKKIGSLQAAQLIHANQEYQTAIERIVNLFSELSSVLNKFNSLWRSGFSSLKKEIESTINELSELFPTLDSEIISSKQVVAQIAGESEIINKKIVSFIQEYRSYHCIHTKIDDLKNSITTLKKEFEIENAEIISENFFSGEIENIEKNLEEINKNQEQILRINESLISKSLNLNEYDSIQLIIKDAKDWFIKELKEKKSDSFLQADTEFDRNVSKNSQFRLNDISYYTIFEKEVDLITKMLNELITKLNIDKDYSKDESSIEDLQKLYTMNSEREVHHRVTGQKIIDKSTDDTKGEDVEFF